MFRVFNLFKRKKTPKISDEQIEQRVKRDLESLYMYPFGGREYPKDLPVPGLDLLLEHLDDEQRWQLATKNSFTVRSKKLLGGRYTISYQGPLWFRIGRTEIAYCVTTRDHVPQHDLMLMEKILIENDEEEIWRTANVLSCREGRSI